LVIYFFLQIYFRLAPNNLFWCFVQEGTEKTIMEAGQALKGLIQWKSHVLNENWDIVEGEEKYPFGGLRWVGLWPKRYIYTYGLRWTSVEENGMSVRHEAELDSVLLKFKIYAMKIEGAEDSNRIPLDIDIFVTLRVVNPYKAMFIAEDYLELVLNRTGPLFREYTASYNWEDLISQKQKGENAIWERLEKGGMVSTFDDDGNLQKIGEFERDFGVRIKNRGIEIKAITPDPKYQEAATKEYLAGKEAKRIAIEAGAITAMMAESYGITIKEMQKRIEASTKYKREFMDYHKDIMQRKIAIDGKSFLDIRVDGAEGIEKSALNLMGAWQKISSMLKANNSQQEEKQKPESLKSEEEKREITEEEKLKEMDKEMEELARESQKKKS
jgi:hypothetical protein